MAEKLNITCEIILAKISTSIKNKGDENHKAYLYKSELGEFSPKTQLTIEPIYEY